MNSKQLSIILGIIVVVLLGVVGYMALKNNQSDTLGQQNTVAQSNLASNNSNLTQPLNNTPVNAQSELSNSSSDQAQTDWKVYKNQQYGFQITLKDNWKGYIVKNLSYTSGGVGNIAFCLPTNDKLYNDSNCGKGYGNPMIITVYTKAQWQAVQKQDGPKPELLGQNSKYVFGWSMWQDPPSDYQNVNLGYGDIVSTFKPL